MGCILHVHRFSFNRASIQHTKIKTKKKQKTNKKQTKKNNNLNILIVVNHHVVISQIHPSKAISSSALAQPPISHYPAMFNLTNGEMVRVPVPAITVRRPPNSIELSPGRNADNDDDDDDQPYADEPGPVETLTVSPNGRTTRVVPADILVRMSRSRFSTRVSD
jgi:hypothetical protein